MGGGTGGRMRSGGRHWETADNDGYGYGNLGGDDEEFFLRRPWAFMLRASTVMPLDGTNGAAIVGCRKGHALYIVRAIVERVPCEPSWSQAVHPKCC